MALIPLSDCEPGFEAFEYNVVVLADQVEEKTKGGIILVDNTRESTDAASVRGLLVNVSPAAFGYEEWADGTRLPQPGDHVIFAKYAGTLIKGDDGREYRLCKDRDIAAVIKPKAEALKAVA